MDTQRWYSATVSVRLKDLSLEFHQSSGMTLYTARLLAERLLRSLTPYCVQAVVAGSIRREKPHGIKDIEIVALPTITHDGASRLHAWATSDQALIGSPMQRWIKTGTSEIISWDPAPDGKYWRGLLEGNVKLDLFLPTPEAWGLQLLIRTGSAEFSASVASHALYRTPYRMMDGRLVDTMTGQTVPCPDEESVFRTLGLQYVHPRYRTGKDCVRMVKK